MQPVPARAAAGLQRPPLALYVHLPWCVRKCPYCDFNSHARAGDIPERRYVDALLADLDAEQAHARDRSVVSVFIGGGTPSLFSPQAIERLLDGVRSRVDLDPSAEVTLEANPGAADAGRFTGFAGAGVNRLSVGVQSFQDRLLERIGRVHDARAASRAVDAALASGVRRVNIDLMFGLPGQSGSESRDDVERACASGVGHVSYYQLTVEPATAFHRRPPALPDHDRVAAMQRDGLERLDAAGLRRYEVSAFAREGQRCAHNLNYWRYGDYLGIGAGAHGKLTLPDRGRIVRRAKQPSPRRFMDCALAGDALLESKEVPPAQRTFEFLLNALRLEEGFSYALFESRTGLDRERLHERVSAALEEGLLECDAERVRATRRGARFLDDLLVRLLPD